MLWSICFWWFNIVREWSSIRMGVYQITCSSLVSVLEELVDAILKNWPISVPSEIASLNVCYFVFCLLQAGLKTRGSKALETQTAWIPRQFCRLDQFLGDKLLPWRADSGNPEPSGAASLLLEQIFCDTFTILYDKIYKSELCSH